MLISELVPVDRAGGRDDRVPTAGHTGSKIIFKTNVDESAPDKSWGEVIGKAPIFHRNPGEL